MSGTFTKEQVEAMVRAALIEQAKLPPEKFALAASIRNDLGIDSLDIVELMFDLEKRFEIVIPDKDLLKIVTIGNLIDYLIEQLNTPAH